MLHVPRFIIYILYFIAVNVFIIYVHYIAYFDRFQCFACKELDFVEEDFDYIVVGSGSAGSIVAQRLAEDKDSKVLLLEAGGTGNSLFHVPPVGVLLQQGIFDWQYKTTSQDQACQAFDDKASRWPMGKISGGTSMLSNMIYLRGHEEDFARFFKNKDDYNFAKDITPYFEKLENSSILLSDLPFASKLSHQIMKSAQFLNHPINHNNVEIKSGFSVPKVTLFNGKRFTSAQTLHNLKHQNLVIHSNSLVTKLLFENDKVTGVKFSFLDEIYTVNASKAVILSAGVIGSPKLLLLSGIGPENHLKELKIKTRVNLPVGENLQDHVTTGFDLILLNTTLGLDIEDMLNPISAFKYFVNGNGPLTTVGCENLAFFNLSDSGRPDLQLMVVPFGVSSDGGYFLRNLVGLSSNRVWQEYFSKIDQPVITILAVVLHPKSSGSVKLKSRDPFAQPVINPNYLSDRRDVDVLLEGIRLIKELINTPPMRELGARLNQNPFPGCENFEFDTKSYWECYVRQLTQTSFHPGGTCRLGDVVEYDFRVKSVRNLYVVDGSVLPEMISGNPLGSIMMLAEKAADSIKRSHQKTKDL